MRQHSQRPQRHSRPWNEAQARRVLEEWRQSGKTLAEFFAEEVAFPRAGLCGGSGFAADAAESAGALTFVPATIHSTSAEAVVRSPNGVHIEIAKAHLARLAPALSGAGPALRPRWIRLPG